MAVKRSRWWGLDVSDRARARMQFEGKSPWGDLLWTPEEDRILREFYPDHTKLKRLLPRRTIRSLQWRACVLKITRPRNAWTGNEISRLRRRWRDASEAELIAEFPRHTLGSIRVKGTKLGIRRRPWQPKPTGKRVLDEVRRRAADLRISLAHLDRICLAGEFFSKSSEGYETRHNVLLRAIAALGGRVEIVWR